MATPRLNIWSAARKNKAAKVTMMKTMMVVTIVSLRVGHVTRAASLRTWRRKSNIPTFCTCAAGAGFAATGSDAAADAEGAADVDAAEDIGAAPAEAAVGVDAIEGDEIFTLFISSF